MQRTSPYGGWPAREELSTVGGGVQGCCRGPSELARMSEHAPPTAILRDSPAFCDAAFGPLPVARMASARTLQSGVRVRTR